MKIANLLNTFQTALAMFILAPGAWAIPTVRLVGPDQVDAGESFEVSVFVDDVSATDPLIAFGFRVAWSPSDWIWNVNGTEVGSSFNDDSSWFHIPDPESPGSWLVDVAGSTMNPVSGDGILLAKLSFTASQETPGYVQIRGRSWAPSRSEGLFTVDRQFNIPLTRILPVPDSSFTGVLLTFGLGSLMLLRKRE